MAPGGSLTVGVTVQGSNSIGASPSQIPLDTTAPTGTVQICLTLYQNIGIGACSGPAYSQTVPLSPLSGTNAMESLGVATFPNLPPDNMEDTSCRSSTVEIPFGLPMGCYICRR